ncbi:3'-5' exonuclease [Acetobacterium sp.]|uniref:HelD family protein n=1 Tax=Acetobacterium sp. TaxID=1872094 RepID=UPI000CB60E66|nr:3'-5' exonuclease [Acetobacterium sp.]MDO9493646.1 3'-5' exonuclease [Acetobacterium sp.]PKM75471.1 MAG: helicase [Firmicutes bacterium HGW-Firmicutes-17]
MNKNNNDWCIEEQRLKETLQEASLQLDDAMKANEKNREMIREAKKEIRENTSHGIGSLWGSDGFEALVELSQAMAPVTERTALYEFTETKIAKLRGILDTPYFARIDFCFSEGGHTEPIYIGHHSLKKENAYKMLIHDWRSPVASVFYRYAPGDAWYDAPVGRIEGKLLLKRQFEIKDGHLDFFFDADLQVFDDFLKKLLSSNTSPKMKTIVESIQRDQDLVIRDMENDLLIVQGVAGSGKTSIALHRAAYLMYQGLSDRLQGREIIIVSPHKLFEQYIANVIPELGEENVRTVIFDDILKDLINRKFETKNIFLERILSNGPQSQLKNDSMAFKGSADFIKILDRFIDDIPRHFMNIRDIRFKDETIFTRAEIISRLCTNPDTPMKTKLGYLEEAINETVYGKWRRPLKSLVRNEMMRFAEIDALNLYQQLFETKGYFFKAAAGIKLPATIDKMLAVTKRNLAHKNLNYDDAVALAYLSFRLFGAKEYASIKQVIIDESQDYYPLHYEILNRLFLKSKLTILGDINQTLQKNEDISFYEAIAKRLNRKKSALVTMNKSYRCTSEILRFSKKFINDAIPVESFNRSGEEPILLGAADTESLVEKVCEVVCQCEKAGYQSIGLILKTQKNTMVLYEALKQKITVNLIRHDTMAEIEGVSIMPVYLSKGLEFDAVLLCDISAANYHSEADKRLLYIACTRALHRLYLLWEGNPSPLLTD